MKLFHSVQFGVAALALSCAAHAAPLTFGGNNCAAAPNSVGSLTCYDWFQLSQSYGDTTFVDVTYTDVLNSADGLRFWMAGYNNLSGVVFAQGTDNASHARITLTAATGYMVNLSSFGLGAWEYAERDTHVRVVSSSSSSVYAYDGLVGTNNIAKSFSAFGASGSGTTVTIDWFNSAYNVGLDNLDFTVTAVTAVPEPESYALLLAGLGLLGAVARKKRRA